MEGNILFIYAIRAEQKRKDDKDCEIAFFFFLR